MTEAVSRYLYKRQSSSHQYVPALYFQLVRPPIKQIEDRIVFMATPMIKDDPLYRLLREGRIDEFNQQYQPESPCDLRGVDLRAVDLRKLDPRNLDLGDCYLRQTDLRGLDLSATNLEGASISGAKISGTLFPKQLSADEISLSLVHGTRLRYR